MYIVYNNMRQRHHNILYDVKVEFNDNNFLLADFKTLKDIAVKLNEKLFSGFPVVSRSMVSNWLYYPTRQRSNIGQYIEIIKIEKLD